MMSLVRNIAVVAVLFPIAAFADLTGTVTLSSSQSVNLETGQAVSSGGDLLWNGSTLAPQGKVVAANLAGLGLSGTSGYSELTQALLQEGLGLGLGSSSPIGSITVGTLIGAEDNSGNVAKLLVTAVNSSSITMQYDTYGASSSGTGTGPSAPTITQIQNNYGLIVPGLPNYGIAPGSLFIIRGSGMASIPVSSATLQSSSGSGIPTTLNGASISVTVNGTTVHPGIYYAGATQIAAVLPSSTPVGTGTLTVTYNSTPSATAPITVVASALGLDTYYGSGTGLGVATNPTTGALYNYTNSITPGNTIVLWGSGLGADTADSDTVFTSTPHAVTPTPSIYIGGVQATVLYAGSAGYPGVNQINVTVPASVPTGCGVSVVAVSGSGASAIVSNTVTLPIMPGGGTCSDTATGISGSTISNLTGKTNYNSGALFLLQSTSSGTTQGLADGVFQNVQTTSSSTVTGITSVGSCTLTTSALGGTVTSTSTGLNAGTITVTGPSGTQTLSAIPTVAGDYIAQLPSGFIPASGGSYTFAGTGGSQVGSFSVSVAYTSPLVWTNSSSISSVTRVGGQPITWTGGASGSYVYIGGSSSSSSASASFVCYAPVSAGSFTVPPYVLLALPAGSGTLSVENITTPVSFSASGLDYGIAFAGVGFSISPSYQ
jgi:uncharacterized protein (TIGR03437 family)